jgi:hypothetical protein
MSYVSYASRGAGIRPLEPIGSSCLAIIRGILPKTPDNPADPMEEVGSGAF